MTRTVTAGLVAWGAALGFLAGRTSRPEPTHTLNRADRLDPWLVRSSAR